MNTEEKAPTPETPAPRRDLSEFTKWKVPAAQGAIDSLLDYSKILTPTIAAAAEKKAMQRAQDTKRPATILRVDVEQAIIAEQTLVIAAQGSRIRDLVSENKKLLDGLIAWNKAAGAMKPFASFDELKGLIEGTK